MSKAIITLEIPNTIYQRLLNTASATQRSLEDVIVQALKVGSPPVWDNVPDEFQTDLANLDQLDDSTLWEIARTKKAQVDMELYNLLLAKNKDSKLTENEQLQLNNLRYQFDLFMLRKAQAAALLHWRGYQVPNS